MQRFSRAAVLVAAAAAALATACQDVLDVDNPNRPDRTAVLRLPRDVEALSSQLYRSVHTAHFGTNGVGNDNLDNQLRVASFENASVGLSNFGMSARSAIPRAFIDNVPGGASAVGNRRDFQQLTNAAGTAAAIFERINQPGFTLGTGGGAADDARLRAFTWFGYGVALGDLALAYDSAGVPRPGAIDLADLPLVSHDSVMRIALRALDSAQANAATASALPATWLTQSVSRENFVRIIRSYKARYRAGVARTPAERDAVDWPTVVADARAGIASDFVLQLIPSGGWEYVWLTQHFISPGWHSQTMYIIGMADSTGGYDNWLATTRDTRGAFIMRTRDNRFAAGNDRAAQIANSPAASGNINARPYWRTVAANEEASGQGWQISSYQHNRWRTLFNASRVGPWITFSKVENDMLAAEGLIRTGDVAAALPLINASRTAANLPPITSATATDPVPGGQGCVPRVPDPARNYTATKCGDVFEAMKWEKRLESAFAGFSVWYFDSRGWGDLPVGTAISWPVPFQERDARELPTYLLGGTNADGRTPRPGGAAASVTYGFGVQN